MFYLSEFYRAFFFKLIQAVDFLDILNVYNWSQLNGEEENIPDISRLYNPYQRKMVLLQVY